MTQNERHFAITDPRNLEGDPYEVAEKAVRQVEALNLLIVEGFEALRLMVRNAQLERELVATGECDAPGFEDSPQGRILATVLANAEENSRKLKSLAVAAGYDPKNPPKA